MILLCFSLIGFIDLVFDLHLGLKDEFNQGLATMGSLSLSMLGILTVGVVFIQSHIDTITSFTSFLPFDPSVIFGAFLPPDMGGYSISSEIASSTKMLFLNGVLLSSIMGQTITFQIPVFAGALESKEHPLLFQSFIYGIIVIPVGLLLGGVLIGLDFSTLLINWLPILLLCGLIAVFMKLASSIMIRIFSIFAKIIQYITYLLFLIAVVGYLFPSYAYVEVTLLQETMLTILKMGLIVAGSLVLSKIVLRYFGTVIKKVADRLGINEVAMIGLILSFATSLAMLPLYNKMDHKGKMINGAFSVSGAYFMGGQLAYISSMQSGSIITIYIVTKLICGFLSILVVCLLTKKPKDQELFKGE